MESSMAACEPSIPTACDPLLTACEPLLTACEPLPTACEPLPTACEPLSTACELLPTACEPLSTTSEPLSTAYELLSTACEPLSTACEPLYTAFEPLSTVCEPLSTVCEPLPIAYVQSGSAEVIQSEDIVLNSATDAAAFADVVTQYVELLPAQALTTQNVVSDSDNTTRQFLIAGADHSNVSSVDSSHAPILITSSTGQNDEQRENSPTLSIIPVQPLEEVKYDKEAPPNADYGLAEITNGSESEHLKHGGKMMNMTGVTPGESNKADEVLEVTSSADLAHGVLLHSSVVCVDAGCCINNEVVVANLSCSSEHVSVEVGTMNSGPVEVSIEEFTSASKSETILEVSTLAGSVVTDDPAEDNVCVTAVLMNGRSESLSCGLSTVNDLAEVMGKKVEAGEDITTNGVSVSEEGEKTTVADIVPNTIDDQEEHAATSSLETLNEALDGVSTGIGI